jgi:twinkle protein
MKNIFNWEKIITNKTSGKTKAICPECVGTRSNKKDTSLQVNFVEGYAFCHYCQALSFRDSVEKESVKKDFKLPVQTWKNYTTLSDKIVLYLESRKLSQFTAIALGVTEEVFYQPKMQKEVSNITFNFFEAEIVVNKKYRSANKAFTQSAGTKSIFYNINAAIGQTEVYITEGEFDVMAMYEIGIKNCISVPNGANDNDAYWENSAKYLKDVTKFFIATDNDTKGDELAERIAQRLGRWRCERVNFEGKDANEDLIAGVLEKTAYAMTKYPVSGTFRVNDIYDDIVNLYDHGLPDTIYPKHPSFGNLRNVFSVMRGHLVVGTGIPSHGKSTFTEWYVLNLLRDYPMKASFFSPEHHPLELHQSTFIQKVYGRNFFQDYPDCPRITKQEIARYAEWANERIYLTCPDDGKQPTWDWLLEKFKEQMISYGTDIFVVDAFNKLEFNEKGNKLDMINSVLTRLTGFAQSNNVIIFLIAHPTKMRLNDLGVYSSPSLYDVAGSADFRNQTHDGYSIHRHFDNGNGDENKTVFTNLKTKMSFQGHIGQKIEYDFHVPSGRYFELGTERPTFCLLDTPSNEMYSAEPIELPQKIPLKKLLEAFEMPDDYVQEDLPQSLASYNRLHDPFGEPYDLDEELPF